MEINFITECFLQDMVYLEGTIVTRSWEKDGEKKESKEISFNSIRVINKNTKSDEFEGTAGAGTATTSPKPKGAPLNTRSNAVCHMNARSVS